MEKIISSIIKIVLLLCLLILCVQVFIEKESFSFEEKGTLLHDETYSPDVSEILVSAKASDIIVKKTTDERIRVVVYGNEKDEVKITKDQQLKIELEKKNKFCFGFCFFENRVELFVPESYEGNFSFESVSGDIKVDSFLNQDGFFRTVSGDIEMEGIRFLEAKTTSGDIEIGKSSSATISTVSGEIAGREIEGKVELFTTSGDVQIGTLKVMNDSKIKTISGEVEIKNITGAYVETKTISGDVSIKNNDRFAEHILKIETTSGDIEVKKDLYEVIR